MAAIFSNTEPHAVTQDNDAVANELATDDSEQPALGEILRAVKKCTESVSKLKEHFGSLRQEIYLLDQDLQKIRERTTATESRISDIGDGLHPLTRNPSWPPPPTTKQDQANKNCLCASALRIYGGPVFP